MHKAVLPPQNRPREIHLPSKSMELAEFIGVMMGDGGLSKYQGTVTLHHVDDAQYSEFVVALIQRLFRYTPSVQHLPRRSVRVVVMSRIRLVTFLHDLGLPIGDKMRQNLDVPPWIQRNKYYRTACIRGLIDTDGSVFTHRYKSNGKWYSYKKLAFTSASPALIRSVASCLADLGIKPRISRNGKDVRIDSVTDMQRFFRAVGTSNPKHWKRYLS